jgi:hypothetical protein
MKRFAFASGLVGALVLGFAVVQAGGSATVTLDEPLPEEVEEGDTFEVGFTVKQHGINAVNEAFGEPIEAVVVATNADTGEKVQVVATQEGPTGHFVANVELPKEGDWDWSMTTWPLENLTQFDEPTVASAGDSGSSNVLWAALGLPAAAAVVVGAMAVRRRRAS